MQGALFVALDGGERYVIGLADVMRRFRSGDRAILIGRQWG